MSTVRTLAFADLLKRYRASAGLTQEELATKAGLSPKGISDLGWDELLRWAFAVVQHTERRNEA